MKGNKPKTWAQAPVSQKKKPINATTWKNEKVNIYKTLFGTNRKNGFHLMAATHKKSIFYNIVKYDNKVEGKNN